MNDEQCYYHTFYQFLTMLVKEAGSLDCQLHSLNFQLLRCHCVWIPWVKRFIPVLDPSRDLKYVSALNYDLQYADLKRKKKHCSHCYSLERKAATAITHRKACIHSPMLISKDTIFMWPQKWIKLLEDRYTLHKSV